MLSFLRGKILNKSQNFIILEANNIGYQIFINAAAYADLNVGQEMEFYLYHHVREDMDDLYGFKNFAELEFFKLLLSVSGVGPKSALGVLGMASVEDIKESIGAGDPSVLTKVSGVGKKTAERIVLELRGKIDHLAPVDSNGMASASANSDEIDALMSLGYSLQQARDALKNVDTDIKESGERIRAALRGLSRK
ncbi:MAG: Holliday junction branch migration protein RuvA [Patescibacteria group bacterium]